MKDFMNKLKELIGIILTNPFLKITSPSPLAIRLFRLLVGAALLLMYVDRHKDVSFLYGSHPFSLLPKESWAQAWLESQRPSWFFFVPDSFLAWLHGCYLILIVVYMFSWGNRGLTLLTWLLHLYFLLRNPMVWFGADLVANLWLMYSVLLPYTPSLFVKKLFSGFFELPTHRTIPKPHEGSSFKGLHTYDSDSWFSSRLLDRIGVLLILSHLMIIYLYTGLEKLRGATWWDGTALWYALANSQMVVWDTTGLILNGAYWLIPVLSWLTVCFEIFFPLGVFLPKPWPWFFIVFGLLFHASIGVLMALVPFSLLMMAPYVFFPNLLRTDRNLSRVS